MNTAAGLPDERRSRTGVARKKPPGLIVPGGELLEKVTARAMLVLLLSLASCRLRGGNTFSGDRIHTRIRDNLAARAIPQVLAVGDKSTTTSAAGAKSNAASVSGDPSAPKRLGNATRHGNPSAIAKGGNATLPKKFGNASAFTKPRNATAAKRAGNGSAVLKHSNVTAPKRLGNASTITKARNATALKRAGNGSALLKHTNATARKSIKHSNATAAGGGISAPAKKADDEVKKPDDTAKKPDDTAKKPDDEEKKPDDAPKPVLGPINNGPLAHHPRDTARRRGKGEFLDTVQTVVSKTIGIVIIVGVVVIVVMVLGGLRLANRRSARNAEITQADKPLLENEQFL